MFYGLSRFGVVRKHAMVIAEDESVAKVCFVCTPLMVVLRKVAMCVILRTRRCFAVALSSSKALR